MKMIIVAAGQGNRLKPLTNQIPKCMVKYKQKPIIDYILEATQDCGINKVAIVNGYKSEILENYLKGKNINFFKNKDYQKTNMVYSLFCAKDFMDDDLIISYSDIIYKKNILHKLIETKNNFSVVVDKDWRQLWNLRMPNPLEDAETLKIKNDYIIEIGKTPNNYDDIEGQYIGLIKIKKNILNDVIKFYENLDKDILYDNKNFENMYMTSFIQRVIDNLMKVKPLYINGGWIEIDSLDDLKNLENINENFNL
jgi:choline kinase